ncbi:MAG: hypothetical protein KAT16_10505, partial [Candidatus Heimdallarchaeota archaeon]|nr:hypothetical protein [Candidatus Heimdallarchaeota archaeon]
STGENFGNFNPVATMTIAFPKVGLLQVPHEFLGELYVGDIGVPIDIYENRLGIKWQYPFSPNGLYSLSESFISDTVQLLRIVHDLETNQVGWTIVNL